MDEKQGPTYRVIFEGDIVQGENPIEVKNSLAELFKVDISRIEKMFERSPLVIKKGLNQETALKYKTAIERTGVFCSIKSEEAAQIPATPIPLRSGENKPSEYQAQTHSVSPEEPAEKKIGCSQSEPGSRKHSSTKYSHFKKQNHTPHGSEEKPANIKSLDKDALKSLGIGFGIFLFIVIVPFLSYIFHYIITLVHELGHAVFGWIFGYFSIPAFDFMYGGGVTIHQNRNMLSLIFIYLLFGWLIYVFRRNKTTILVIITIAGLYSLAAFTSVHYLLIISMGHGAELIFASIFLYRALTGSGVIVNVERPLYAFLAFFIFYKDFHFAYNLMYSPLFREDYAAAKGGGHWMDFSRIAREYLNVDLTSVAAGFMFFCLITPALAFLFFRYKPRFDRIFQKILSTS